MMLLNLNRALLWPPPTVAPGATLATALTTLRGSLTCAIASSDDPSMATADAWGCLGVVDHEQLIGILTERDLVRLIAAETDLETVLVSSVMATPPIFVSQADLQDPFAVLGLFQRHGIRHLPVVDDDGWLVGLITTASVQRMLEPSQLLQWQQVAEVMQQPVVSAAPEATVVDLAQLMAQHAVSCVVLVRSAAAPSLDQPPQPVGLVSERDLLHCPILALKGKRLSAEAIMQPIEATLMPQHSLWQAHATMAKHGVQQLLVTDDQGDLLGMVTQKSILRGLTPMQLYQTMEAILAERGQRTEDLAQPASQDRLLASITSAIHSSLNLKVTLQSVVDELHQFLRTDRVIVYRFHADWSGTVVAEAVTPDWMPLLGQLIRDPHFAKDLVDPYRNGRVQVTPDVHDGSLTPCHVNLLQRIQVKALIVVPIVQSDLLWGLLAAQECAQPRPWQPEEVELLQRLSTQVAIAIQQAELYESNQRELQERQRVEQQLRQRTERQEFLAQLGHMALKTDSIPALFDLVVERLPKILKLNYCGILELLPNRAALQLKAGRGWPQPWVGVATVGCEQRSQYGYTLATDQPVTVEDLRLETRFGGAPFLHNQRLVAGISLVIAGRHQPYGILAVHSRQRRRFSLDEVNFVQAVANMLASAMIRQQTERELNRFFNLSQDLFCIADGDGQLQRINPRFTELLGHSEAELLRRPLLNFVHTEDQAATQAILTQLHQGLTVQGFENRWRCHNGSYRWIAWSAIPLNQGTLIYAVGRDVTQTKETEVALQTLNEHLEDLVSLRTEALQRSEAKLQALIDQAGVGIKQIDLQGRLLQVNQKFSNLLGYAPEDLVGQPLLDITYPEDWEADSAVLRQIITGDTRTAEVETRKLHRDGHVLWAHITYALVRTSSGKPDYIVSIVQDITERRRSQQELLRQKNLRDAIFNYATDALFLVDPKTLLIVDCNQRAVELFQANSKNDLIGRKGGDTLQKYAFTPAEIQEVLAEMAEKGFWTREIEYVTFLGREFWGSLACRPLTVAQATLNIVRVTDISERKRAEAQALAALEREQELNTLKTQFISMASHEFRTPLTTIMGSAELLRYAGHKWSEEKRQRHFEQIKTTVQHMAHLVEDVLLISRADSDRLPFHPRPVQVSQLCQTLIDELTLADQNRHQLQFDTSGQPYPGLYDQHLLRQIVTNLMSNALKYSPEHSTVTIRLIYRNDGIALEIQDQGIGIPQKDQGHLFQPFSRATNVGNRQGTGLGLVIVKKAIEMHNGHIEVESTEGVGTLFKVWLPK
ncbi:Two-component sensor histidine kinase [Halomicronema hongdechloris C2206]|uniref:histidine kinase n=1 Tax=Halomicronema hongdechloris C2206 TaxID=1641165 RepID=A0A1Z3HLH3_9CYAN|nr:PAS domain S-box protein [Halomicronema hongdechloris]ASC71135.1 Two-component sensor histidine kinase [Halomicronema hongdechloris C2206]